VLAEWNSGNSFAARCRPEDGTAATPQRRSLLLPNVLDDTSADQVDFLNGAAGNDWLIFVAGEDKVAGR